MVVGGEHGERAVGQDGIKVMPGEGLAGAQNVVVCHDAEQHFIVGVCLGIGQDRAAHLFQPGEAIEVEIFQFDGPAKEMHVAVDKARQHRAALRINHLGLRADQRRDLGIRPDRRDLITGDGQSAGLGLIRSKVISAPL